jgi:hypothetical protein
MKQIHLAIIFSMSSLIAQALHLKEAINSKAIVANWTGISATNRPAEIVGMKSPSMQAALQNKTSSELELDLEEGFFLMPEEQGYQRMLITQKVKIKLKPNERKEIPLYAMCTQLSHSGPNAKLKFKLGERAQGDLLSLAQLIALKNYQNYAAQDAVWSFTDGSSILGINSSNPAIEDELQSFVAKSMKIDLKKLKLEAKAKDRFGEQHPENLYLGKKIDRNITFRNDTALQLKVGYYDQNGSLLATIVTPQSVMPGQHSIRYNPFPLGLHGKRYSVKMYHNDELFREYYFRQ